MFISFSGYRLIAFISHMGTSTMCGHYVCHVLKEGRYLFVLSIRLTAPWAASMSQLIPRCDWLSERAIARSGLLAVSCEKIAIFSSNKFFIDQGCSVKMAEKWPGSFLMRLWTSTPSWSINSQNKGLGQYPSYNYPVTHFPFTTICLNMYVIYILLLRARGARPILSRLNLPHS